jgi:hypothetical protein
LNTQERSALHAARARWHPLEAKARRERAEEIVYLIKQALKDGKAPTVVTESVFGKAGE